MRIKDTVHINPPQDVSRSLVIYPGVPEHVLVQHLPEEKNSINQQNAQSKYFGYIMGYFRAASSIMDSYQGRAFDAIDDDLAYPILFLLRHAVELSLKFCLKNIRSHFEKCALVPKFLNDKAKSKLPSLTQHSLAPILKDIIELCSHPTHHESTQLDLLRDIHEEIEYLDQLDPEATAFRYPLDRSQQPQELHATQRWVEVDKVVDAAKSLCNALLQEAEPVSFELCSGGFLSTQAMNALENRISALREASDWLELHGEQIEPVQKPTTGELNVKASVDVVRKWHSLIKAFLNTLDDKKISDIILGFYTASDGVLLSARRCKQRLNTENFSSQHLCEILERRRNLRLEQKKLEECLERIRAIHAKRSLPEK